MIVQIERSSAFWVLIPCLAAISQSLTASATFVRSITPARKRRRNQRIVHVNGHDEISFHDVNRTIAKERISCKNIELADPSRPADKIH